MLTRPADDNLSERFALQVDGIPLLQGVTTLTAISRESELSYRVNLIVSYRQLICKTWPRYFSLR
jgi:hypothetical protein